MRSIPPIILLALVLVGCKTQKSLEAHSFLSSDSLAHSTHTAQCLTLDSCLSTLSLTFDTLTIDITRPTANAESPEVIRLKATKGNLNAEREQHKAQLETYNHDDTVAFHQSTHEQTTEHTATTRLYDPPSGTALFVCAILAIAASFVFLKKRK